MTGNENQEIIRAIAKIETQNETIMRTLERVTSSMDTLHERYVSKEMYANFCVSADTTHDKMEDRISVLESMQKYIWVAYGIGLAIIFIVTILSNYGVIPHLTKVG